MVTSRQPRPSTETSVRSSPSSHATQGFTIGIWGTVGSGKTTYLAMLYGALQQDANVIIRPEEEETRLRINRLVDRMYDGGVFPEPTDPSLMQYHRYNFNLYQTISARGSAPPIQLSFIDAPGKFYEDLWDGKVGTLGNNLTVIDYLKSCHGIIVLLDPLRGSGSNTGSYRRLLSDLLDRLAQRTVPLPNRPPLVEQYIAFCVSKVDMEDSLWDRRESPYELVEEVLGSTMFKLLPHQYCHGDRYQFYAVSSIGRQADPKRSGRSVPNVTLPEKEVSSAPAPLMPPTEPVHSVTNPNADDYFNDPAVSAATPETKRPKETTINNPSAIDSSDVKKPIEWLIEKIYSNPPDIESVR